MLNYKRFKIENFVSKISKHDRFTMIKECQDELEWLEGIRITKNGPFKKEDEWMVREYIKVLRPLLGSLFNKIEPNLRVSRDFYKTKPIYESLVEKGQWGKEVLDVFNL